MYRCRVHTLITLLTLMGKAPLFIALARGNHFSPILNESMRKAVACSKKKGRICNQNRIASEGCLSRTYQS